MRTLLVEGNKTFKVTIPDDAKVTFGPWSPGEKNNYEGANARTGTLRVYADKSASASILGVWSGVKSFREVTLEYSEQVAKEEGAIIWKSDKDGYNREEKVSRAVDWNDPLAPKQIPPAE
jgi:hypothetical protein